MLNWAATETALHELETDLGLPTMMSERRRWKLPSTRMATPPVLIARPEPALEAGHVELNSMSAV